jgi:transcriptional regulator with XRE-family HTH domain
MTEPSLGVWLRRERERRGITLKTVAEQTKVAVPLLEGLESGDLARWPGGIYRRAFVKAYASALSLDPDEVVKRFEQEHPPAEGDPTRIFTPEAMPGTPAAPPPQVTAEAPQTAYATGMPVTRARTLGTVADLTVALVLAMGSAAAGSRLLWPVMLIACYYGIGVLLTGTSPMVALLSHEPASPPRQQDPQVDTPVAEAARPAAERRHSSRRSGNRPPSRRSARARVQ